MRTSLRLIVALGVLTLIATYRPSSITNGVVDPRFGLISLEAQTVASTTTLSAAITDSATSMTVASATGFTVGNKALIDQEVVLIRSVVGTVIGIARGRGQQPARAHASGNNVTTGASQHFYSRDPEYNDACTRGSATSTNNNATYLPWINDQTGTVWTCTLGSVWKGTSRAPLVTYASFNITG